MMLTAFFEAVKNFGQPMHGMDNDDAKQRLVYINPSLISTPSIHPRRNFETAAMLELCASISRFGIINPLTVRLSENGRYETVCGARRLRAAKMLSLERVPCIVVSVNGETAVELAGQENGYHSELLEKSVDEKYGEQCKMQESEAQTGSFSTAENDKNRQSNNINNDTYNKRKETCKGNRENAASAQSIKISLKDGRLILNSVNRLARLAQDCGAQTSVDISPSPPSSGENDGNFETVCLKISFPAQDLSKISDE